MASALADDEKELEVNVDYPAIRITNIFVHVNPHLHTATHGFEKSILTSGYPIKQQSEGFFIVFASTTARAKFKKNSKWLNGLRKDHKTHKVNTLEVASVMYNLDKDGFLEPIFKISFFYPDVDSHYRFSDDERMVLEYLNAGGERNIEVATNICCDVLGGPPRCVAHRRDSITFAHCTSHISMLVLANNVGQAFEKRNLLRQAIMLRELCLAKVHMCQARSSVLASILHLTQLEYDHNLLGNESNVKRCLERISEALERLQELTGLFSEDRKDLTVHNFAFGLHCIKKAGISRFFNNDSVLRTDFIACGLRHLNKAISSGKLAAEIDREEAMVVQAAKILVNSMIKVVQDGATPEGDVGASAKSSSQPKKSFSPKDSPGPEEVPVQAFENLSINPTPFKLCSRLKKVSDSDIEVEILGAGPKQVNIFEVDLFGTDDQPVRWQNTNLHDYFLDLEQKIASGKNFVSVALNSEDEITKLWVKEYNLDDEVLSEEVTPAVKSVTFSNTKDIFGEDKEDLEEEEVEDLDAIEFLSCPAEVDDFVTVGDSDLDKFFDKLRSQLVEERRAGKKTKEWMERAEREADEMMASLRGQADWLEKFLKETYNDSSEVVYKDKKYGNWIQRLRLPKDVDEQAIRSQLQENYRKPHSAKFNPQFLLKTTANLFAQEVKALLDQKLRERLETKDTDRIIQRRFKTFYLERYTGTLGKDGDDHPPLEYEEVNKILEESKVTLTFIEQGWKSQANFEKFCRDNLKFMPHPYKKDYNKFILVFRDFFTRFLDVPQGGNSKKDSDCQEDIITVIDSEDKDAKEDAQADSQVFYKKNPELLYVGNLPKETTKEELTKVFEKYGKVKQVIMKYNYCFVGFHHPSAVEKALKDCPIMMRGEHKLKVGEGKEKVFVKNEKAGRTSPSSKKEEQEQEEVKVSKHLEAKENKAKTVDESPSKETLQKMLDDMTEERDRYISLSLKLKDEKAETEAAKKEMEEMNAKLQHENAQLKTEKANGEAEMLGVQQELNKALEQNRALEERNKNLEKEMQEIRQELGAQTEKKRLAQNLTKDIREEASSSVTTVSIKLEIRSSKLHQSISSVPLDRDGLLLLTDVQDAVGEFFDREGVLRSDENQVNNLMRINQSQVNCLFYYPTPSSHPRLLVLEDGKFHPPQGGWADHLYRCKISIVSPSNPLQSPVSGNSKPPLLPTPHSKLPNPNATLVDVLSALPTIPPPLPGEFYGAYFPRIRHILQPFYHLLSEAQAKLLDAYLKQRFNTAPSYPSPNDW